MTSWTEVESIMAQNNGEVRQTYTFPATRSRVWRVPVARGSFDITVTLNPPDQDSQILVNRFRTSDADLSLAESWYARRALNGSWGPVQHQVSFNIEEISGLLAELINQEREWSVTS